MKVLKIILTIVGAIMILGGISHLYTHISIPQKIAHVPTIVLNIINALAYMVTGYGLLKLRYWFLYAMGTTISLIVLIICYNQYISNISPDIMSFGRLTALFIILVIALVFKDRILKKKK